MTLPVFITTRDRLRWLRSLVFWLELAGVERITLLDNDSTYEPLLEYLEETPHSVIRGENDGSQALWIRDLVPDEPFILTDPDVVPANGCPLNLLDHLAELLPLAAEWKAGKVAVDLIDASGRGRVGCEVHVDLGPLALGGFADTTLAAYPAGAEFEYAALITREPYVALHHDPLPYDDESRYYLEHARGGAPYSSFATRAAA